MIDRLLLFALLLLCFACRQNAYQSVPPPSLNWETQQSGISASIRGICAVDEQRCWISGSNGTYAFTTDGGGKWTSGTVPGADSLDFRDVEAFPNGTVFLMSAGPTRGLPHLP